MEQDEPGVIDIAGASTKVDSLKKKVCFFFFLKIPLYLFANNLNPSERISFANKSGSFKTVQRNRKARIKTNR